MTEQRGWPYDPVDTSALATAPRVDEPVALSVRDPRATDDGPDELAVRRPALIALVVVATVSLLLASFSILDWLSRNQELDVLLARIRRAEQAQLVPRDTIGLLLRSCALSDDCDVVAIALVAERSLPELEETGEAVAQTRLTRHHLSLRDLRDRYVEHNVAWRSWLRALADGVPEHDAPVAIETTFYRAALAAKAAVPPFAMHDAPARVDDIFGSALDRPYLGP